MGSIFDTLKDVNQHLYEQDTLESFCSQVRAADEVSFDEEAMRLIDRRIAACPKKVESYLYGYTLYEILIQEKALRAEGIPRELLPGLRSLLFSQDRDLWLKAVEDLDLKLYTPYFEKVTAAFGSEVDKLQSFDRLTQDSFKFTPLLKQGVLDKLRFYTDNKDDLYSLARFIKEH